MKANLERRRAMSLAAAAVFLVSGALTSAPAPAQEFVMKLAHVVNPGSPRDKLMHLYGQNLAKRTNGRIKAQVFPSGQLGGNRQIIEGVQLGTIEATIAPTAFSFSARPC